jgi:outer membrane lipoprotein
MNRLGIIMLGATLLAACASQIPEQIRNVPENSPSVSAARAGIKRLIGARVRWGGTIANVENRESQTWIEVVARDLQDNARPRDSDRSQGRFLARVDGFLDPAIYSKGREITVVGSLDGQQTRAIDKYEYRYPVVDVQSYYLWERIADEPYARDPYLYSPLYSPFYYDPFYDPFYYDPFSWRNPYYYW